MSKRNRPRTGAEAKRRRRRIAARLRARWIRGGKYIWERGRIVPVSLLTWARWFEHPNRRILASTRVGDVRVSTAFLGLDHSYGSGPAVLLESALCRPDSIDIQARYTSYRDAMTDHRRLVAEVTANVWRIDGERT